MSTAVHDAGAGAAAGAAAATLLDVRTIVTAGVKRARCLWHASTHAACAAGSSDYLAANIPAAARARVAAKVITEYAAIAMPDTVPRPMSEKFGAANMPTAGGPLMLTNGGSGSAAAPAAPVLALTDVTHNRVAPSGAQPAGAVAAAAGGGPAASAAAAPLATPPAADGGSVSAVDAVVAAFAARCTPQGVTADSVENLARATELAQKAQATSRAMVARRAPPKVPKPAWHAPWKLMRVISGHLGWVHAVAVDASNEWFATGSADRTIKIWDLASGALRVTLTGHINTVRALAVSDRHPYLFSAGEDKSVKCWDLNTNQVVRHYHGHLSGVYCMALHPTLDILMTGGRDSVCRVWDMRTKAAVHVLAGHENTIASMITNSVDPQVITGSMDNSIRLWDLAAGRVRTVLTHHKKSVRGLVGHPREFAFVSGAADNIKKWALPDGVFVSNYAGHNSIINSVAMNDDDVLVSGGDDGTIKFWDYSTGYCFQESETRVQPGSLDSEAGILAMAFDRSGGRLITAETDKSIKVYREDPAASEETHPIDMSAWTDYCRRHKKY